MSFICYQSNLVPIIRTCFRDIKLSYDLDNIIYVFHFRLYVIDNFLRYFTDQMLLIPDDVQDVNR